MAELVFTDEINDSSNIKVVFLVSRESDRVDPAGIDQIAHAPLC